MSLAIVISELSHGILYEMESAFKGIIKSIIHIEVRSKLLNYP